MDVVTIKDKIQILDGGQGRLSTNRSYLVKTDGQSSFSFVDRILSTVEPKISEHQGNVVGRYSSIANGYWNVMISASEVDLNNELILEINTESTLSKPFPDLVASSEVSGEYNLLTIFYQVIFDFPFNIDEHTMNYKLSFNGQDNNAETALVKLNETSLQSKRVLIPFGHNLGYSFTLSSGRPLPVLLAIAKQNAYSFKDTDLVLVLHMLDDLPFFTDALINAGASPEGIYLIGVPYSAKQEVQSKIISQGIESAFIPQVYPFENEVDKALEWVKSRKNQFEENGKEYKWMVIEDGGYVIPRLHLQVDQNRESGPYSEIRNCCVGGVEQTRNGIWSFVDTIPPELRKLPLISVADSTIKLGLESHWIGRAVVKNTENLIVGIGVLRKEGDKAVVIGAGSTGTQIAKELESNGWEVSVVDSSSVSRCLAKANGINVSKLEQLGDVVQNARLIIGSTGRENVISADIIQKLGDGTIIVNSSSKRREVDWNALQAYEDPQQIGSALKYYIHDRYGHGKEIFILADGYPVNFYTGQSVDPANIEIIMACLFGAAVDLLKDAEREDKKYLIPEIDEADNPADHDKLNKRHAVFDLELEIQEEIAEIWEVL